jgi:hypothetical protein
MASKSTTITHWSEAARDGLFLALVTVVLISFNALFENAALKFLFWLVKFVGSIWLLYFFMKKFLKAEPQSPVFRQGVRICLFSSLICAVYTFFMYTFLFPEMVTEMFEAFYSAPEFASLPGNVTDMMLKLEDNFARYSCIATFFWNFILGLIISAIIARSITPKTIFTDDDNTI